MTVIDIGKDFSKTPFGRFLTDGSNSATRFREELLKPAFNSNDERVIIDFSRVTLGVGSSFLEESFGGLVRGGVPANDILERIEVKGGLPMYSTQIKRFVERASLVAHAHRVAE